MFAFMTYTRIVHTAVKICDAFLYVFMARTPDNIKKYLCMKKTKGVPDVLLARGYSIRMDVTYDITNFITMFLNWYWDPTACGNEGGIQLERLRNFMNQSSINLVWICYSDSSNHLRSGEKNYMLIDLNKVKTQVFKHVSEIKDFQFGCVTCIVEPMFDEISFSYQSEWN